MLLFQSVVDDIKESNTMARGQYKAIDDIVKRPVNEKVQFEGTELIIPENTVINPDSWTLLDLKTGYGLPIGFSNEGECLKKTIKGKVYGLSYNDYISGVNEIGKKIEKANNFIYTCK